MSRLNQTLSSCRFYSCLKIQMKDATHPSKDVPLQSVASESSAYWTHPVRSYHPLTLWYEEFRICPEVREKKKKNNKHTSSVAFAMDSILPNAFAVFSTACGSCRSPNEFKTILFPFPKPLPEPSPRIKQHLPHECQGPPSNNLLQPPAKHTSLMIFFFFLFPFFFYFIWILSQFLSLTCLLFNLLTLLHPGPFPFPHPSTCPSRHLFLSALPSPPSFLVQSRDRQIHRPVLLHVEPHRAEHELHPARLPCLVLRRSPGSDGRSAPRSNPGRPLCPPPLQPPGNEIRPLPGTLSSRRHSCSSRRRRSGPRYPGILHSQDLFSQRHQETRAPEVCSVLTLVLKETKKKKSHKSVQTKRAVPLLLPVVAV